ncbi:pyridoxamine 5'-phosphate oxidase family protein [Dickeya zeae]|uniref:pyridoxamine 5'-phosphate oxidase family protein n=1 Tax=Dickeya zeae TaxID=204042 RepID=UPI0003A54500|nr:pyridoxamine 5'-phosphate oxidase family protein [Dickeya zeae]AUQ25714.1 pyridoxamine 5'-phosphate oxidase [Dickeya zeae]MCA6987125.1 pyridoxamine 5'-phosphate oxidase family protein [Dickeya zeae]UJR58785.1 pyridoxamine 5'-phosphate oxidase [Dickeya zeae]
MMSFHPDERRAQQRAGFSVSSAAIRDAMPIQHQQFFAGLRLFFIATRDRNGWPVATVLSGTPGFLSTPDARQLLIGSMPTESDPLTSALHVGGLIGGLGIDFMTRRRNRVNGVIDALDAKGIRLAVRESFGNCPQYIRQRCLMPLVGTETTCQVHDGVDDDVRKVLQRADTAFVASYGWNGMDISHRGGPVGFIRYRDGRLWIPDFRGNRYMNTLGNLLAEPRATLLILDWVSGDLLQIQGDAAIHWEQHDEANEGERAERYWSLRPYRVWRLGPLLSVCGPDNS